MNQAVAIVKHSLDRLRGGDSRIDSNASKRFKITIIFRFQHRAVFMCKTGILLIFLTGTQSFCESFFGCSVLFCSLIDDCIMDGYIRYTSTTLVLTNLMLLFCQGMLAARPRRSWNWVVCGDMTTRVGCDSHCRTSR